MKTLAFLAFGLGALGLGLILWLDARSSPGHAAFEIAGVSETVDPEVGAESEPSAPEEALDTAGSSRHVAVSPDPVGQQARPHAGSSSRVELLGIDEVDGKRVARLRDAKGQVHAVTLVPSPAPVERGGLPPHSTLVGDFLTISHDDGSLYEAGEFRDGERQGEWTSWSPSGQRELEGTYVDGKAQGTWRQWHANGTLALVGETSAGRFEGQCNFWHDDGTPDMTRTGWYEEGVKVR